MKTLLITLAFLGAAATLSCGRPQQHADKDFDTTVKVPTYGQQRHPRVVIDEAHRNFHTADGRYKPFAELLRHDGYEVDEGTRRFTSGALKPYDVLVISNAFGPEGHPDTTAFAPDEIAAVNDWVQEGGNLLLIADHWPCGGAAAKLSQSFGVDMGLGTVEDSMHCAPSTSGSGRPEPTTLLFTRDNALLGDHPIINGRNVAERVGIVETFTGQSLGVPPGATPLLKLADTAFDRKPVVHEERVGKDVRVIVESGDPVAVAGRAQGVALEFGKGRVVVLGEAAMMTAQIGAEGDRFGMNVPGIQNRQFALNAMHWLSRLY